MVLLSDIVAFFLPGLGGGGAEHVILTIVKGLADSGVEVELVVTKAQGALRKQVPANIRLVDLRSSRIISSLLSLKAYLQHRRPKVLVSSLSPANCVAIASKWLSGVPTYLVVCEHSTISMTSRYSTKWRDKLIPKIMRCTYQKADHIVAVSKGVARDLSRTLHINIDRIEVIYNPVVTNELEKRSLEPVEHPWFGPDQPPVILGAGRLIPVKQFSLLVRAFAQIRRKRNARLVILGEGSEKKKLEAIADRLGCRADVSFPGFVQNPYSFMRRSKVFVLSSKREGLPTVLIEAMACGTAVVSTDCPSGPAEILSNGKFGYLIKPGNKAALIRAIETALDNKSCTYPADQLKRFSFDCTVSKYLNLIRDI